MSKDHTAYWCTCLDNPTTCLGCNIEKLTLKVLGEQARLHLMTRIMPLKKPQTEPEK